MNIPMERPAARRFGAAAVNAPRMLMSWEDWLTFAAALITFVSVAVSIDQANWVRGGMPAVVPTVMAGLVVGMFAARVRVTAAIIHPAGVALGLIVVALAVQSFADGDTIAGRLADARLRMVDWWAVVRSGDISNDNLPFVTLVQSICYLSAYLAAYAIYRWHNPWVAILPMAIVLLANISLQNGQPTTAFLFFVFGAVLLIARLHLQKNQSRWRRLGVDYPEFISLSAGQLTLVVTVGLLFFAWLVPVGNQAEAVKGAWETVSSPFRGNSSTFGRLFNSIDARNGGRLHNFGAYLAISGDVKLGTKQLFEIKATEPGFIRGTSYDEYTGSGWKVGPRDRTTVEGGDLAASPEVQNYEKRNVSVLQVTVRDGDTTVLSQGMPLGTNVKVKAETPKGYRGDIEQLSSTRGLNAGDTYNSIGSESLASEEDLAAAGTEYPAWVAERYLQLPKDLPQRVRDEAAKVGGSGSPYEQAVAIEAYLRSFPYNLGVSETPVGRDVADYVLFDLKSGYFDTQATAMAVMLRSLGIPARIAVGFILDENEVTETTYTVRKDDQYSWVEVWFPRYGWVNFNPTADRPAAGAVGAGGTGGRSLEEILAAETDLQGIFGAPGDLSGNAAAAQGALDAAAVQNDGLPWTLIWSLIGVLLVFATAAFSGRLAWNWGLGGIEGNARLWAKTQRVAAWARLGSGSAETPREWSRRVGEAVAQPDAASNLASAYEETRYGRPDLERVDPEETQSAYRRLRNTLFATVFRSRAPKKRGP
ncbi:MAG: transglutaminaseTgpA domain-containing protein [Dehalococcoidia bacterium]